MFSFQHETTSITINNNLNEKIKTLEKTSVYTSMYHSRTQTNEFSGKRNIPVESSSSPIRSDFNLFRSSLFSRPNASRLSFDESDLDDVSLSLINSRRTKNAKSKNEM